MTDTQPTPSPEPPARSNPMQVLTSPWAQVTATVCLGLGVMFMASAVVPQGTVASQPRIEDPLDDTDAPESMPEAEENSDADDEAWPEQAVGDIT